MPAAGGTGGDQFESRYGIRRTNPEVVVPMTAGLAEAWGVSPVEVDAAALHNLRQEFEQRGRFAV